MDVKTLRHFRPLVSTFRFFPFLATTYCSWIPHGRQNLPLFPLKSGIAVVARMTPCRLDISPFYQMPWHFFCHFVYGVCKAIFRFQSLFLLAITTPQSLVVLV